MGRQIPSGVIRSMITEEMNMAYREPTSSLPPISFQPSRNRGMFSTMRVPPTGRAEIRWWMIWATPVRPPEAMLLGWKNHTKPTENTAAPRVMMR